MKSRVLLWVEIKIHNLYIEKIKHSFTRPHLWGCFGNNRRYKGGDKHLIPSAINMWRDIILMCTLFKFVSVVINKVNRLRSDYYNYNMISTLKAAYLVFVIIFFLGSEKVKRKCVRKRNIYEAKEIKEKKGNNVRGFQRLTLWRRSQKNMRERRRPFRFGTTTSAWSAACLLIVGSNSIIRKRRGGKDVVYFVFIRDKMVVLFPKLKILWPT